MLHKNSRYYLNSFQAQPSTLSVKVLPENMESLGDLIQRRMNAVGITSKSELARRIGKSAAYVGDLINNTAKTKSGTYKPSPEVVAKLSNVLEVSEIEILNAIGYTSEVSFTDDSQEIINDLEKLSPKLQYIARKQIRTIISTLAEVDETQNENELQERVITLKEAIADNKKNK